MWHNNKKEETTDTHNIDKSPKCYKQKKRNAKGTDYKQRFYKAEEMAS